MDTRIIFVVRHGETLRDDDERRYLGQLDVPLSERGRRQATDLGQHLPPALGAIFASDLSRAVETAELASGNGGPQVIARPDLREIAMGEWEGRTFREIAARYPREFAARGRDLARFRPPGGESFVDCGARVVAAFHEIMASSRGDVLIVGHAGVNRLLLCHLLGMLPANLFRLGQEHACVNVIRREGLDHRVALVNGSAADVPRLHAGLTHRLAAVGAGGVSRPRHATARASGASR